MIMLKIRGIHYGALEFFF